MSHQVIWASGKDGDSMIVARDGILTLVTLPRQAPVHNSIILHFILCFYIKFKGVE
jgi:hypothetical protein